DEALTPVVDEDAEHMELYTQNEAARTAVERERRVAAKTTGNGNGGKPPAPAGLRPNGQQGNGHDAGLHDAEPHLNEPNEPISPLV
ncbi:MAG: hypothetical protein ACRECM_11790, partial [Methyloceanibacter sp.]